MNREQKEQNIRNWIAALRSGKYDQTTGALTRVNGVNDAYTHCCLGVVCQIENLESKAERAEAGWTISYRYIDPVTRETQEEISYLPASLCGSYPTMIVKESGTEVDVVKLNDVYRFGFEKIADILESIYLGDCTKAVEILYPHLSHLTHDVLKFGMEKARDNFYEE